MDLTFIGRNNGREFIMKTTPVFFKYMTLATMVEAVSLRKQLRLEEATALFREAFDSSGLTVTESYSLYRPPPACPTPRDLSPSRSLTRGVRGGETCVLDVTLGTVAVKSDAPGRPPVPVEPSERVHTPGRAPAISRI
jgi:hypothetical protein